MEPPPVIKTLFGRNCRVVFALDLGRLAPASEVAEEHNHTILKLAHHALFKRYVLLQHLRPELDVRPVNTI
jgi:hypothetical protein